MFYVDENQKARFIMPYEFPLAVHETYLKDKPREFNDWHWHEEIQFSCILEGEMIMSCMGNEFLLRAGDGIFINSNCAHMSRPACPESARYLSLNIQPSLLTLFHGSVVEQKYFLPYANDPQMQVMSFSAGEPSEKVFLDEIRHLFGLIQKQEFGYELEAYAQLLHVWRHLLERAETEPLPPVKLEREEAHAMLMYIHENFADRITIRDLAAQVHLSRGECSRLFQTTYGTTIVGYILDYRVSQSIPLLTKTDLSMAEVAMHCGFGSPSYYTKVFREKVGMPPLQYRRTRR